MTTQHWAADLIHRPYERGATGPDAFDCWGLVRYVFERVHGIAMPAVAVGEDTNLAAIQEAARVSGWRSVGMCPPQIDDIAIMTGFEGKHVGVMVEANGSLLVLHCIEGAGVCAQPLSDLGLGGFKNFEFWRRTRP